MEKIPTAKEFMQGKAFSIPSIENMMIEFAKLHIEKALEEAGKNYYTDAVTGSNSIYGYKELILNSYPLENIK